MRGGKGDDKKAGAGAAGAGAQPTKDVASKNVISQEEIDRVFNEVKARKDKDKPEWRRCDLRPLYGRICLNSMPRSASPRPHQRMCPCRVNPRRRPSPRHQTTKSRQWTAQPGLRLGGSRVLTGLAQEV